VLGNANVEALVDVGAFAPTKARDRENLR